MYSTQNVRSIASDSGTLSIKKIKYKSFLLVVTLFTVLAVAGCAAFTSVNDQVRQRQIATIMDNTRSELQLGHNVKQVFDQAKTIRNRQVRKQFIAQKVNQMADKYNPQNIEGQVSTNKGLVTVCVIVIIIEFLFILACLLKNHYSKHQ